jgi:hypothetical protein
VEEEEERTGDTSILNSSDDEYSDEEVEESDHNTESDQDFSDESGNEEVRDAIFYVGKDKVSKWRKTSRHQNSKTKRKNIVKILPRPRNASRNAKTEIEAFANFLTVEMIDKIVFYMNSEIERQKEKFSRIRDCKESSRAELMALFGILYLIGTRKGHHTNVLELWAADGTGLPILRSAMSYNRFLFFIRNLRFNDKATRDTRRTTDKLAAIREIFDDFVNNCLNAFSVSEFVTIDEMLLPFTGRCSWVQNIPSKPAKYA